MKVGVAGNGTIVKRFLKDAQGAADVSLHSICVREQSRKKGRELADLYGLELFDDYEAFLRCGEVDTVYIGLTNPLHFSYAKKALEAGKHVICEKPLTVSSREAEELAETARKRGLFLWEAFKLPYAPILPAVREQLSRLGPVHLVQCSYCRTGKAYQEYAEGKIRPVLDPEQAGGSLYDVNVYQLHFVTALFGAPKQIRYAANRGFNGVDTSGTALLRYPDFLVVCTAAMDCGGENFCLVQGERGWIRVEGPVSSAERAVLCLDGQETVLAENREKGSLRPEIAEFARQLSAGDYDACYEMLDHSLQVMKVLDAARSSLSESTGEQAQDAACGERFQL